MGRETLGHLPQPLTLGQGAGDKPSDRGLTQFTLDLCSPSRGSSRWQLSASRRFRLTPKCNFRTMTGLSRQFHYGEFDLSEGSN